MHILFLTDNFSPEVNAPASRTFEHCREWVRAGHRVTVLTCAPNFPRGKVFAGYRNALWETETMDGIRVIRVWTYIAANEGVVKRTLDYQSFMVMAVLCSPMVRGVHVVVGTSPQFFTACAAYLVGRLKRVPFVFELRDLWPDSIKAVGVLHDSLAVRLLERIELFLYRKASRVVAVTESFRSKLALRGIDPGKVAVVTNGVDLSRFSPRPKDAELQDKLGLNGKFVAGYVGTHGLAHGLETVLEAARRIRQRHDGDAYRFIFLGDGARKQALVEHARDAGLTNVLFLDSVLRDDVVRYWTLLDVSIIHLKRTDLFASVIPSKLFECIGMGIPVLHGVAGESAQIVQREGVGLVFEPENAEQLCAGLVRLKEDAALRQAMRNRCSEAAHRYSRPVMARRMLAILEAVAQPATPLCG